MAVAPNLAGNGGFPYLDHQTTQNLLQSDEKLNPISSTRLMNVMADRRRNAAREGGGAIASPLELPKIKIQSTTNLKKSMGRERRRRRAHQREEERLNSTGKPRR
jgi:hypothetical protein